MTIEKQLDEQLNNKNIFYMLCIDAELTWVKLRSEMIQPLYTLITALFHTTNFAQVDLDIDIKAATQQVEKKL